MAKELIFISNEQQVADDAMHSTHRTKDITRIDDEQQRMYCLDCGVEYSDGAYFTLNTRKRMSRW